MEAAAATSLWIVPGQQTADIAVNGQDWTWRSARRRTRSTATRSICKRCSRTRPAIQRPEPFDARVRHDVLFVEAVAGPAAAVVRRQAGPVLDLPADGRRCPPATCPANQTCTSYPLGTMCTGTPDPVGASCNYTHTACDSFCLYTALDLSTGYCSQFCTQNTDCPLAYHCGAATSGTTNMVCLLGAQPIQDPCTTDADCAAGTYCNGTSCTFDCRSASDCTGGDTCDDTGRCAKAKPAAAVARACRARPRCCSRCGSAASYFVARASLATPRARSHVRRMRKLVFASLLAVTACASTGQYVSNIRAVPGGIEVQKCNFDDRGKADTGICQTETVMIRRRPSRPRPRLPRPRTIRWRRHEASARVRPRRARSCRDRRTSSRRNRSRTAPRPPSPA